MRLYLVTRESALTQYACDVANSMVVAATSEATARQLVALAALDEGPALWATATVEDIGITSRPTGVVLMDASYG